MAYTRPQIECTCGLSHFLTPSAMAVIITAFINGSMQTVGSDGVVSTKCLLEAFEDEDASRKYDGRHVAHHSSS